MMFKDTKPYYKANVSFDGGSGAAFVQRLSGICREGDIFQGGGVRRISTG